MTQPPQPWARTTGFVYLLFFLTAICAGLLVKGLIVPTDAAATSHNLLAHERLLRSGFAVTLISTAFYVALTALFYNMFRPVNRTLSLLAAFLSLVGCGIQVVFAGLYTFGPPLVLGGDQYLTSFNPQQLQALAFLILKIGTQAFNIALVFFGFFDFLIGYLISKSTFLPRFLAVLMMLAGVGWLATLSPSLLTHLSPGVEILGFVAELALMLWLIIKGVNLQRWNQQSGLPQTPP
jgi:hypothetical protein